MFPQQQELRRELPYILRRRCEEDGASVSCSNVKNTTSHTHSSTPAEHNTHWTNFLNLFLTFARAGTPSNLILLLLSTHKNWSTSDLLYHQEISKIRLAKQIE